MNEREVKIIPPDGYEIDRESSTLDCIKFKPIKKKLTYDGIVKELFKKKETFWINSYGNIGSSKNGCTSQKQARKLLAINQLMNVAKYLNGDWKPNWGCGESKYYLKIDKGGTILVGSFIKNRCGDIYFKSEELAKQAVEILGKNTIDLALSTDY